MASKGSSKKGARRGGPSAKRKTKSKTTSRFVCPTCGFVARHAMGLGRHRSARHGVVSVREARRRATTAWITRREAARRAGVHYNTIRHWERAKLIHTARKRGVRDTLVNAADLTRVLTGRRRGSAMGADERAALRSLQRRYDALVRSLQRLAAQASGK